MQAAGEIFLEPAGEAGPESFAGDSLIYDHAVPSPTSLAALTTLPTMPGSPVQIASYLGGTPGLYGGSRSKLIADKDAQLTFLQANLDKAAAFCAALNADPTLKWSGGNQVTVEQLAAYFAELTPVLITRDIRVTNHGFRNGKPTPRQSILQAGQYVLVDIFGVPRARCECGNPLIPPMAVATKPRYTGKPWPGFDPTIVIVVQPATREDRQLRAHRHGHGPDLRAGDRLERRQGRRAHDDHDAASHDVDHVDHHHDGHRRSAGRSQRAERSVGRHLHHHPGHRGSSVGRLERRGRLRHGACSSRRRVSRCR